MFKFFFRNIVCFLLFFLIVTNCKNKNDRNFDQKTFDSSLIKENEILRLSGNYNGLVNLNQKYLKKAKEHNYNEGQALCYINLANICGTIGNYKDELSFLRTAEKKITTARLRSKLYQEYGQVYFGIGLYIKALQYNSRSIEELKKVSNSDKKKFRLERVYINRADFLYKSDIPDSSLKYLHKGLKETNAPITNALIAKHHLYYTNQLDSSLFYIKRAWNILPKNTYPTVQKAVILSIYADYYYQIKEYQKSLYFYNEALQIYKRTNRFYNIPGTYESIAKAYKSLKDTVNERHSLKMYTQAKKKLDNNQNEAINYSIELLLSEKDKETNGYKKKLLIFSASLITLIGVIAGFVNYKRKQNYLLKQKQLNTQTVNLKNKLESNHLDELFSMVQENDPAFLATFTDVYPQFTTKLLNFNSSLTSSELALCAMIALNFTSKEIANYTYVQHKSVQQKKYRIRKKLNIPGNQDLFVFFRDLLG